MEEWGYFFFAAKVLKMLFVGDVKMNGTMLMAVAGMVLELRYGRYHLTAPTARA